MTNISEMLTPKALLLALGVMFIWGSNFIAIKVGVNEFPPLALLTLRFTLAGLLFLPFCKWPGWRQAITISLVGMLMGPLHQGFLYASMTTIPVGFMSILLQSNVILVTLIGWLFYKEKIGWRTWSGITLSILGVIILIGMPEETLNMTAYFLGFASAFFLALNYIGMKQIGSVHPVTYIVFLSLPNAPLLLSASLFFEGSNWIVNAHQYDWMPIIAVLLYQSIILSLSHIAWQKLMVKYPVNQLIPLTLTVPVFAILCSWALLGEAITFAIVLGGSLTIAGIAIVTFRKISKESV